MRSTQQHWPIAEPRVYVGGDFSSIGGQPRIDLAKLNPITGLVDGDASRLRTLRVSGYDVLIHPVATSSALSSPSSVHGITVTVQVAATILPATGVAILGHAILNSRLILSYPKPSIVVKAINADVITYEVTSFVADLASATPAQNDLLDLISRHLSAAHVRLAKSDGTVSSSGPEAEPASDSERVLAQSTIFAELTPEERAALAKKLQRKLYEPGEVLLEPGVVLSSLFLVGSGVLSVTHPEGTKWAEILRLGPDDHFGEIGLLTGVGSIGRITALTPTVVYELPKTDLAPILEARPQVAHELSRALAQRQAAGRMVSREPTANATHWFSERLQQLFKLRNE